MLCDINCTPVHKSFKICVYMARCNQPIDEICYCIYDLYPLTVCIVSHSSDSNEKVDVNKFGNNKMLDICEYKGDCMNNYNKWKNITQYYTTPSCTTL